MTKYILTPVLEVPLMKSKYHRVLLSIRIGVAIAICFALYTLVLLSY